MCGIAGYATDHTIDKNSLFYEQLCACLDDIAHRGPDDFGIEVKNQALLGHRRLSIIDLSSEANQPFRSKCGNYTLVFNGEIYNYVELRNQLESQGIVHYTTSDTEVLLNLLVVEGERCISKLNGMFAFGFYDSIERKLLLVRDRFGKKPLFYNYDGSSIVFCSELYPLRHFDKLRNLEINQQALSSYFSCQFISGNETIYKGINQVPAASYLVYEAGKVDTRSYWRLNEIGSSAISFAEAKEQFLELLRDAVKVRMRADVPLGAFLSGGLDSSVISRLMLEFSDNVKTFSMGFEDASYDESSHAISVADVLGTEHINKITRISIEDIKDILKHLGQPMADPSVIPFWELCKQTREYVTVALSGDGADEILGGYKRYLAANTLEAALPVLPGFLSSLLDRFVPEGYGYYGNSWLKKLRLSARLVAAIKVDGRLSPTLYLDREKSQLLQGIIQKESQSAIDGGFHRPLVRRMMLADMHDYMKNDILVKVDSMSMAHSLEVRSPFLDYRLVEFVTALPLEYAIAGGLQKRLLREIARDMVPKTVINRPKHGFAVPVSKWFATALKADFLEYLDQAPAFISKCYANRLLKEHCCNYKDHGLKLWSIFIFLLWYRHYKF